jgi:hypothetical protein
MNMGCKEVDKVLIDYHENSLTPDGKKAVEEHLKECQGCRRRLQEIERTYRILARDSVPSREESFWVNFVPEVRSRIGGEDGRGSVLKPRVKWALGLVSVLAVVILSWSLLTLDRRGPDEYVEEPAIETTLALSDPYSYADQLVEIVTSYGEEYFPAEMLLPNEATAELGLAEEILEQDYADQTDLGSLLRELSLEELKQLEEQVRNLKIGDIL